MKIPVFLCAVLAVIAILGSCLEPSRAVAAWHPLPDSTTAISTKLQARNLGLIVNDTSIDFGASFTPDGRTMYFVSRRPGGLGRDDIWMSTRASSKDTLWAPPKNVAEINTGQAEGGVSIATDGKTIYFATNWDTELPNDCIIWTATLEGTHWKNVHALPYPVNTTSWESQPCISPDGKRLFFVASPRPPKGFNPPPGFKPQREIRVCHKQADGSWSAPVSLGPKINTTYGEGTPFMAADGVTLYFFSRRPGGLGGADIYQTEFLGPTDGDWTEPVRLNAPVNSAADDIFFSTFGAGDDLFVTSNRAGSRGGYDLWEIR